MVIESTISSSHQRSSCYDVPIINHRTANTCSTTASATATCFTAPHQHTHAAGLLQFLVISIYTLVAYDTSLASISSEVSDDSLSRLVACIGCRVSLPTSTVPLLANWWGRGARHVLCNTTMPHATYEIVNQVLIANLETTDGSMV